MTKGRERMKTKETKGNKDSRKVLVLLLDCEWISTNFRKIFHQREFLYSLLSHSSSPFADCL
jgi:hypothetical protein